MKNFKAITISALLLLLSLTSYSITLSTEELREAGERIYQNETGGIREKLIHWNVGEEFASLGIGHFIWYPENFDGPFDESFPGLLAYYRRNNIPLPELFRDTVYCPWDTREEFLKATSSKKVTEAIVFLENTKDIQVAFIYERLQGSLEGMLAATDRKEHVKEQFYRVAHSPGGLYPLIDYVNFKGEGVKESERYMDKGWGLLQILEGMEGTSKGREALEEFRKEAKFVLKRRVDNSPKERGEERWLPGWYRRIDTYR
ncbi:hypothetical protein PM10SUCC1_22050 [Propionigenium maris DSM 9537]|uniref:Uncharacterized protein n=1 Tax=Propionigenium maris DSM 9537 TaxID=1123000 RepID=A0A9W6GN07_9FUSO|nr:hypothetical protein [Propionigenium maris]GLI56691.1 hypothetical protein PM10SUCC1_22050 [Propionigenium maris DSM 9537]